VLNGLKAISGAVKTNTQILFLYCPVSGMGRGFIQQRKAENYVKKFNKIYQK